MYPTTSPLYIPCRSQASHHTRQPTYLISHYPIPRSLTHQPHSHPLKQKIKTQTLTIPPPPQVRTFRNVDLTNLHIRPVDGRKTMTSKEYQL